jgi:hypothetical protein
MAHEQRPSNEKSVTSNQVETPFDRDDRSDAGAGGGLSGILIAFAMVSVPFIILSATLLGVVLVYRVKGQVEFAGNTPSSVYLVSLNASTIALISSYSSTFASIAVGYAMTLLFHVISKDIVKYSLQQRPDNLPTPYQVGLLLTLRTGGLGSLWQWFKYTFRWKSRQKSTGMLKTSAAGVAVAILVGYNHYKSTLTNQIIDHLGRYMASPCNQVRHCRCPSAQCTASIFVR